MSTQHRRSARRLAGTTVAASLLVATVAASAQAATPTITVTEAKTTVPAAKLMPGSLKLVVPVHTTKSAIAAPCLTKPKVITLKANSASGVYLGKETSIFSPKYLQWDVTVVVFPSAAKAAAAAATLTAAEKVCPKTSTRTVKDTTETWTRSLGTKYTVGSFKGFRSVEHLTAVTGSRTTTVRAFETYLVRGNVLLSLEEVAGATPSNGKQQDTWRKTVTNLMVKRLSALT